MSLLVLLLWGGGAARISSAIVMMTNTRYLFLFALLVTPAHCSSRETRLFWHRCRAIWKFDERARVQLPVSDSAERDGGVVKSNFLFCHVNNYYFKFRIFCLKSATIKNTCTNLIIVQI